MKKLLLLSFIIFGVSFALQARAAVFTEQLDSTSAATLRSVTDYSQFFASTTGNISEIKFRGIFTDSDPATTLTVSGIFGQCNSTYVNQSCTGSETFIGGTITPDPSDPLNQGILQTFTWTVNPFSNPIVVNPGDNTRFRIVITGSGDGFQPYGTIDPTKYPSDDLYHAPYPTTNFIREQLTSGVYDEFFIVGQNVGNGEILSITYPVNGTTTPDFGLWQVNVQNVFASTSLASIGVNYGTSPNNLNLKDIEPWINNQQGNQFVSKIHTIPIGVYYAQAFVEDNTTIIATSSIIQFSLTSSGNPLFPTPFFPDTSTSTPQIQCERGNFVEVGFCKVLVYLFIPGADSLSRFSLLKENFENKPPFGYFKAVTDALGTLTASSSNLFSLPIISGITDTLRNILVVGFWLLLIVYLFKRFRHFEL